MTSATMTPEDVVGRIEDWQGKDVSWEVLGGGITNLNYVVTVRDEQRSPDGERFVLHIPGEGTDTFIDRDCEHKNHAAAAATGVAPPLMHLIEPGSITVVPFIEGETLHPETIAGYPERLEKIVDAVRTYHEGAVFANEIHLFDMIRDYTAMARDVAAPRPAELDFMYAVGEAVEAVLDRDPPAFTASHNDLLSENFILDRQGKMWIIDWEYAGMSDPYFDLGDFCVEHPLSEEEERNVVARYCGSFDEHRYARMMLHKLVADLWWSIWAMIQSRLSKLDFDFYEYGMNRMRRFCRNAEHPDYPRWLAAV